MLIPIIATIAFGVLVLFYVVAVFSQAHVLKHTPYPRSQTWTDQFLKTVRGTRTSLWGVFAVLVFDTLFFLLPSVLGSSLSRQASALFGLSDLLYACLMFALWRWTLRLIERAEAER